MLVMNSLFRMTSDSGHFILPGLEVFNAVKYARDNNKQIFYSEPLLGNKTINALKSEKRMNFLNVMMRKSFLNSGVQYWDYER